MGTPSRPQGIIVVGDINVDSIENKIKRMFSPIEMPANAAERKYFPAPDNDEPIIAVAKDKEQQVPVVYLMHKHDAVPNYQKNNMGYLVMNYMISSLRACSNSRLNELTQQAMLLFIEVGAQRWRLDRGQDQICVHGVWSRQGNGIPSYYRNPDGGELERVRQFGFTASEYARAKADYLRGLEVAEQLERNKQRKVLADRGCWVWLTLAIRNERRTGTNMANKEMYKQKIKK